MLRLLSQLSPGMDEAQAERQGAWQTIGQVLEEKRKQAATLRERLPQLEESIREAKAEWQRAERFVHKRRVDASSDTALPSMTQNLVIVEDLDRAGCKFHRDIRIIGEKLENICTQTDELLRVATATLSECPDPLPPTRDIVQMALKDTLPYDNLGAALCAIEAQKKDVSALKAEMQSFEV
jgi:hypothetical protein